MCLKRLRLGTKANGQLRSCFAHGVSQHLPNESLSTANFALQKYLLQSWVRPSSSQFVRPSSSQLTYIVSPLNPYELRGCEVYPIPQQTRTFVTSFMAWLWLWFLAAPEASTSGCTIQLRQ